jgi:hypothetical protein
VVGLQDPTHYSKLEAAKQQSSNRLPKDVQGLGTKFADLFKQRMTIEEETAQTVIPYYTDLRTNKFAVLQLDGKLDEEDPFNEAIAAFIGDDQEGDVFRFGDKNIKKEALPLLKELAVYIHKLKKAAFDYKVEVGSSNRAALFKEVNNYIADLYWESAAKLTNSLIPKDLLSKYMDKKVNVTKKMTYTHRSVLYSRLSLMNDGPNKDRMANAYCHLIKIAFERGYSLNAQFFSSNFISKEKRFTPTLAMLSIKGVIPDFKVKRFRSLFLSSEIENIRDSAIEKAESKLQELFQKAITCENLVKLVSNLTGLKSKVEDEVLSLEIKKVRRERLLQASRLKASHKKGTFKLNRAVAKQMIDSRVRDAFNPFRLAFAEGVIETAPGLAINVVGYNDDTDTYHYISSEYNDKLDDGKVKSIALEYVAFLEG